MNVYQKINEVKKLVKSLSKDATTSGKGAYTYVSGSQILATIKEKMEELGLLFLPVETESRGWRTFEYTNSTGVAKTDFIVEGRITYEWINTDEPSDRQRVDFDYYGQQNDISKAFGSALTYSERYLLLKSLGAPTDEDDPDKTSEDKKGTTGQQSSQPQTKLQSKYSIIRDLAKSKNITSVEIDKWLEQSFGKVMKINDLSDGQFQTLKSAIEQGIGTRNE